MAEENIAVVRQAYEAFNRGDLEGAVGLLDPDFEYVPTGEIPGAENAARGRDGFKRFLEGFWSDFDDPQAEIGESIEMGDHVLVSLTLRGRGKQSGVEVGWNVFQLWTVRDGVAVRGQAFTSKEEALEAAGRQQEAG